MKKPAKIVDDLLADIPAKKSSALLAQKPELCEVIQAFLDLKNASDPRAHVSFAWFYQNKLKDKYDGPSYDSVRRYVRDVMKLNVATGESLV